MAGEGELYDWARGIKVRCHETKEQAGLVDMQRTLSLALCIYIDLSEDSCLLPLSILFFIFYFIFYCFPLAYPLRPYVYTEDEFYLTTPLEWPPIRSQFSIIHLVLIGYGRLTLNGRSEPRYIRYREPRICFSRARAVWKQEMDHKERGRTYGSHFRDLKSLRILSQARRRMNAPRANGL